MRVLTRLTVAIVAVLIWHGPVTAQIINPPSAWHPYRGGTNCVQVADGQGNFNCSPLVTVDPVTGKFVSKLGGPISTAVTMVIGAAGNSFQALGNDLVIASNTLVNVAPAGPGAGAAVLRIRPSPMIPGYCRATLSGGNSYGQEFVLVVVDPSAPRGVTNPVGTAGYVLDFPGGPGGC